MAFGVQEMDKSQKMMRNTGQKLTGSPILKNNKLLEKIPEPQLQEMAEAFYQSCPSEVRGIFGYGSLIWNFSSRFEHKNLAKIYGYRRSLGLWSVHYRGTEQNPGLVFGLDYGGSAYGLAYFCDREDWRKQMFIDIFKREMINCAYRPVILQAYLQPQTGKKTQASLLTFVLRHDHPQYAGRLTLQQQCAIIANAHGPAGSNRDYVLATQKKLEEFHIPCQHLAMLCRKL